MNKQELKTLIDNKDNIYINNNSYLVYFQEIDRYLIRHCDGKCNVKCDKYENKIVEKINFYLLFEKEFLLKDAIRIINKKENKIMTNKERYF